MKPRKCSRLYLYGEDEMFEKKLNILLILLLFFSCSSCVLQPPRPLTFEEQQLYMAKQQCAQAATDMNPEWPSSSNPFWNSYFVMCMHQFGISNEALSKMWY